MLVHLISVRNTIIAFAAALLLVAIVAVRAQAEEGVPETSPRATALATAFTYQGRVAQNSVPVTGVCDFEFALWDAASGGIPVGTPLTRTGIAVSGGLFTTTLDFGAVFDGQDRHMDVSVRCPAGSGTYVLLGRQALTPTPYAMFASATVGGGGGGGWSLTGNSGTNPSTHFLGTTDDTSFEFRANNSRVYRFEPHGTSPNIIGGSPANSISDGLWGAVIGGGGGPGFGNRVADSYGVIGGGANNHAGDLSSLVDSSYATVGGGFGNTAFSYGSTIGGGRQHAALGVFATIGGGGPTNFGDPSTANVVTDNYGTIGGGGNNLAGSDNGNASDDLYATVGGGVGNEATRLSATVGGGTGNSASFERATIGGGGFNIASGLGSTISGGYSNDATNTDASIGGGVNNTASGQSATVGGGTTNTASGDLATIGGGDTNSAVVRATVGGGFSNAASFDSATVGGGYDNTASGDSSTVAGGWLNTASGTVAVVGGGYNNQATKNRSTIAGGSDNVIDGAGEDATIGGGYDNTVTADSATVAGGWTNTASGTAAFVGGGYGNTASGVDSMVVGGFGNDAVGDYSFAAGRRAQANHAGSFVWADGIDANVGSPGDNTFSVRASGGIWFGSISTTVHGAGHLIDTSTGAYLTTGGVWTDLSDVNMKRNFSPIDTRSVLESLVSMPVTTWSYKAEDDSIRRMGPTAQDFYAAFGLGDSDKAIGGVDAQGVAFAAIQGLYATMQDENADLRAENAELEARVERLESAAGFTHGDSATVPTWAWLALVMTAGFAGAFVLRKVK